MTKNSHSLYSFNTQLTSIEIGADLRVKPSAIANALQEAARKHADHLGWGVEALQTKKQYWVLARTRVELSKWPGYASEIEISTWPKGISGRYALRDYTGNSNGVEFLKATSSWVLMDAVSGRPSPVDDLSELFIERADEHALSVPANKVALPDAFTSSIQIEPLYSDLDVLGHVNNARYLDWAWSAVSDEVRKKTTGWTVNYLKEVRAGQTLTVRVSTQDNACVVVGFLENQKPAFLVSFSIL